jgi:RND family efflux transporter MFP subunit
VRIGVALLLALVTGSACARRGQTTAETPAVTETVPTVQVTTVGRQSLTETVWVTGSLESPAEVSVCPEVSGRLAEVKVEEGSRVSAGEVVAVIEQDSYLAQLHEAEATVAVARAVLAQAEASSGNLAREKERIENLYREGVATEQQRDDILTRYRSAQAALALGGAQVEQARAALELARLRVEKTTLRAPIAGVIAEKRAEQGDMASPQACIFRLVQVDSLKAHCSVSERYLGSLVEGKTPVEIRVDAFPGERFHSVVSKVFPVVAPEARTVQVEVRLPNPDGRLRPGMFCRVGLVLKEVRGVLVIPGAAVVGTAAAPEAFRVREGAAERVKVELGLREGALVEVRSGLAEGDRVILSGQGQLQEGMRVEVASGEGSP